MGFLVTACAVNGETAKQVNLTQDVRSVTLKMRILEIKPTPNDGLRITARAEPDTVDVELVINIHGGKFKLGDRSPSGLASYSFPVFLEPTASGQGTLDRLLSSALGKGSSVTLFKPKGYSGSAFVTPKQLSRKGGQLFLFDPGIEGTIAWSITVEIDPAQHQLSLKIGELRF